MLIDTESVNFNHNMLQQHSSRYQPIQQFSTKEADQYRGNFERDNENARTERNRKSSNNQFAVSKSGRQTPIKKQNRLNNNLEGAHSQAVGIGGTTQKKSKSPVRKPREYTTKVVLDDDDEDNELVRTRQRVEDNVKIGLVQVKRQEIKQPTMNYQLSSVDCSKNKLNLPADKKSMFQTDQTKSQRLPDKSVQKSIVPF